MPVVPGSNPAPTTWTPPGSINTIVKPTRLNFCPNPSIEVSTAGWTVDRLGRAHSGRLGPSPVNGTHSLKVAVHAADDGAYITIPDLIVGDTYIVSAYVMGGPG